ncbi:MAG: DUF2934 domain-containing protein [Hyphomicrobiales bacterium]
MPALVHEHEDAIRARAHQFWLDEGRPEGRHLIHWQRALEAVAAEQAKPAPVSELPAATLKAAPVTAAASDVSLIGGVGAKIKEQLAAEGITTLAQIATLSDKAIAALDAKLGLKGRTVREEWIVQAKELVAGKAPRAKTDKARAKKK